MTALEPTTLDPGAQWITHPDWAEPAADLTRAPLLRRRFVIAEQPAEAELSIAGLGVWAATLDGVPIGADVLEPGSSEYRTRVALASYDVTERLSAGPHELVVSLGEGPAHVREAAGRYTKFVGIRYPPRLVAQLELSDHSAVRMTIISDDTWESALGQTTLSHWYGGEDFDARITADGWVPALALGGVDTAGPAPWRREAPPVRVVGVLEPIARTRLDDASVLLDFGVNHAGRPLLRVAAAVGSGTTIELWPAENTDQTGHVDQTSTGQPIFDTYIAAGVEATWHPSFCYHGYRYLEVRAADPAVLDDVGVTSQQLRSDNRQVGRFDCSSDTLNRIYELTERAVQSNLFSVLTDCPHREKLGWLEQLHLVFLPLAHYFDVRPQFSDMVTHMIDAQTENGLVPDIAPELTTFGGGFRDDVNWGSAIIQLPVQLWRTYGDLEPARRAWPAMQRYLGYLDTLLQDGLLPAGLADWKTLDASTPPTLVHGHGLLAMLESAVALARALNLDPQPYQSRAEQVRARLTAEHVRADGSVAGGSQASYALALDARLVPPSLVPHSLELLYHRLSADDHLFTVGEIALPPLFRVLAAAGRHDLLFELVTNDRGPGYVNMINTGCTALAETWEVVQGEASANHFMLGYVVAWLTQDLAGLRQASGSTGWRRAAVEPHGLDLLEWASAGYDSPAGRYTVDWRWERTGQRVGLDVTVPDGGAVELRSPAGFHPVTPISAIGPGSHRVELVRDGSPRGYFAPDLS